MTSACPGCRLVWGPPHIAWRGDALECAGAAGARPVVPAVLNVGGNPVARPPLPQLSPDGPAGLGVDSLDHDADPSRCSVLGADRSIGGSGLFWSVGRGRRAFHAGTPQAAVGVGGPPPLRLTDDPVAGGIQDPPLGRRSGRQGQRHAHPLRTLHRGPTGHVLELPAQARFLREQPTGTPVTSAAGIRLYRSAEGVPLVDAESGRAVWLALGYAGARDRLFAMAASRWVDEWFLAEFVGTSAAPMAIEAPGQLVAARVERPPRRPQHQWRAPRGAGHGVGGTRGHLPEPDSQFRPVPSSDHRGRHAHRRRPRPLPADALRGPRWLCPARQLHPHTSIARTVTLVPGAHPGRLPLVDHPPTPDRRAVLLGVTTQGV